MGLLSIIKKQKLKDRESRCLVLGLDNSGKSTVVDWILASYKNRPRQLVTPTVGFQIHTVPFQNHSVQLWDIGGQSTLRPYWDNYFDKTDVLLWVIDAAAAARLGESVDELKTILQNRDRLGYNCRIIVLVNKKDLVADLDPVIVRLKTDLSEMLKLENVPIEVCPTSALTGDGLDGLMPMIVEKSARKL
ncbi:LANO_0H03004g1_1 [Lachancea nothofagi CBS 11611]|uniref:LANO_0H03004g1_1 n=1 Tax=Lachancea nothofagi CBS 11611 TaxID=1266666 RepID=A0A1G4KKY5_9SACH|nr:LANO_0H03004g1_1 [Lachancea nothofagi CBS 11611]